MTKTRAGERARSRRSRAPGLAAAALAGLAVAALLTACGGSGGGSKPGTTVATPTMAGDVQVFNVTGTTTLQFSPNTLDAKPGTIKVNFTVPKQSPPHDFIVPSIPNAKTQVVDAGTATSLTFRATKPGRYQFVCSIHANMQGTLNVG